MYGCTYSQEHGEVFLRYVKGRLFHYSRIGKGDRRSGKQGTKQEGRMEGIPPPPVAEDVPPNGLAIADTVILQS